MDKTWQHAALLVVDMQRYYLEPTAPFVLHCEQQYPGSLDYIATRCQELVIPNLQRLIARCRQLERPVIFLRLCGTREDRSDLHPHFQRLDRETVAAGFGHAYPTEEDPLSAVIPALAPQPDDAVFCKTTYSGFVRPALERHLHSHGIHTLICTGLATSQCVETTARDASDRGFQVIQVEDAQADYDELSHQTSLISSRSVCGGSPVQVHQLLPRAR